jgi:thioredoxin-dependent peroxiredoxin
MEAFQRDIASFERLDTQVLGVSPDDLDSHRRFAEELRLTFPLLVDAGGRLASQWGQGRITFLIDKEGRVRHVMRGMPENDRLLEEIRKLGD